MSKSCSNCKNNSMSGCTLNSDVCLLDSNNNGEYDYLLWSPKIKSNTENDYKWCRNCDSFLHSKDGSTMCLKHNLYVGDPNSCSCSDFKLYTFPYDFEVNKEKQVCNTCKYAEIALCICRKHDHQLFETEIESCESWEERNEDKEMKECSKCKEDGLKNPFDYQEGGSHYKVEGTMDIAEWSKRRGHCPYQWNVMKYVDRHKKKNGIEDLRKAKQYLEFIAYVEYGENL